LVLNKILITERVLQTKDSIKKIMSKDKKRNLVCFTDPGSIIAEEFRTIRTNMQILLDGNEGKTILLTSSQKGEGKSTTVANLAVSIAQNNRKVLLIDANLRNPYIHSIFKFKNTDGLTSVLKGDLELGDAVRFSGIKGLDVLTSGGVPLNPAELLGTQKMENLIKFPKNSYDVVLIDTAPILESAETRILAGLCDGVVLIINKGKTLIEKTRESKKVLDFAKANLVGVILNERK